MTTRSGRSSTLVISPTRPDPEVIRATTSSKSLSSYMPRIQDGSGGLAWAIGMRMPTIPASSRATNAEPRRLDCMAKYLRPPRLQVNSSTADLDPRRGMIWARLGANDRGRSADQELPGGAGCQALARHHHREGARGDGRATGGG